MTIDLLRLKDIIIGLAALITACKVIYDIAKKPTQRVKCLEDKAMDFENRLTSLENNSDKLELVLEKVNNLINITNSQNNSFKVSLEERELLIKSNKTLIKAVSALLEDSKVENKIKGELDNAETELDNFIINQSHKPENNGLDLTNIK